MKTIHVVSIHFDNSHININYPQSVLPMVLCTLVIYANMTKRHNGWGLMVHWCVAVYYCTLDKEE
jgi:hypothetical protein